MTSDKDHLPDLMDLLDTGDGLHNTVPGFETICRRWSLLALVDLGASQQILRDTACMNMSLLKGLGIEHLDANGDYDRARVERLLQFELKLADNSDNAWPEHSPLVRNIRWLSEMLGLSSAEQAILSLVLLERHDTLLSQALNALGGMNNSRLYDVLCQLLRLPESDIRAALSSGSRLFRTGLLRVDNRVYQFEYKIDLIAGLAEKMIHTQHQAFDLFASSFIAGKPPRLSMKDFSHLRDNLAYLKAFLGESLCKQASGVNILVYGPPGTGKTELTRVLAQALGASLFEIATETDEGQRLSHLDRLGSFQLSQHLLSSAGRTLLLFDEVENVFTPTSGFDDEPGSRNRDGMKAWANKLLEENPVPAFWLSNDISDLDPAHLRRFNFHFQVKIPPRSVRERIIGNYAAPLGLSTDCIRRIASHDGLSPAVIQNSSKVARAILNANAGNDMEQVMGCLLSNALRAMGDEPATDWQAEQRLPYDPGSLNAGLDLAQLLQGVREAGAARLCLYGPPGSGKTAFGHHLALTMDRPLLVRRASEILGSLLGETERNIALAFEQARDEGAVLLLDEADAFLMDRRAAQRNWEVSGVAEMLTQMESFGGVFVASTNLVEQMDAASLRRFDLKILFDYLKPLQALRFFRNSCIQLGLQPDEAAEQRVLAMGLLTPGDFAAVIRQSRLVRIGTATKLAARLAEECALKPQGRRMRIGF
jgi:SpoVK/Ycf46/Vps4 family AAA+-type ATPase